MKKRPSGLAFYLVLIAAIVGLSFVVNRLNAPKTTVLSEIETQIADGKVESVTVSGTNVEIKSKDSSGKEIVESKAMSPWFLTDFYKTLKQAKTDGKIKSFDYNQPTDYSGVLSSVMFGVMILAMIGFFYMFYVRQSADGKGALSFGKNKARLNDPTKNKVTFADVAGAIEEKGELQEIVDFLKSPQKYNDLGARIPRGILLVGPPGTGKTLLAKAVAGEAGVPFFSISGSDFVEMFVGVGASRVRGLFDDAKKQTPCIVFIDEIDAVGRHRGAGLGGGHDEREQTLNQLLVEMDGFGPNDGVIVMAATNRADILDPALLRPGRFDRRIMVMRPDMLGRKDILAVHARNKPLDSTVDLKEIAMSTPGFTGADLANLLNEAALLAARKNARVITYDDISEAVFKTTMGPEKKSRLISEKERQLTAYHESGHAILVRTQSETDKVERVTIIPTGGAGGYTAFKPHEDVYFYSKRQLFANIMIALGGRAAEQLTQNDISTGASGDLQSCNALARDMVTKYGMSERLGNFVLAQEEGVFLGRDYGHTSNYSEKVSALIDEEVQHILNDAYKATIGVLQENSELLEQLVKSLLAKEKIDGKEFEEIYTQYAVNYVPLLLGATEADKASKSEVVATVVTTAEETQDNAENV